MKMIHNNNKFIKIEVASSINGAMHYMSETTLYDQGSYTELVLPRFVLETLGFKNKNSTNLAIQIQVDTNSWSQWYKRWHSHKKNPTLKKMTHKSIFMLSYIFLHALIAFVAGTIPSQVSNVLNSPSLTLLCGQHWVSWVKLKTEVPPWDKLGHFSSIF